MSNVQKTYFSLNSYAPTKKEKVQIVKREKVISYEKVTELLQLNLLSRLVIFNRIYSNIELKKNRKVKTKKIIIK